MSLSQGFRQLRCFKPPGVGSSVPRELVPDGHPAACHKPCPKEAAVDASKNHHQFGSGRKREAHLVLILHFLVEKLQPGLSKPQPSRLPEL